MSEAVFQVGVKALIMNEENQLLLVSETNNADVYWDIPGGRIDGDESFSQTLERESYLKKYCSSLRTNRAIL